jgi:hypothetical protein
VRGKFLTLADLKPEKELSVPTGYDTAWTWIWGCCGEEKNLFTCQELNPSFFEIQPTV